MVAVLTMAQRAAAQLDPDDPWPKFAHDERNTCRAHTTSSSPPGLGRGPHSTPELRWWAQLDHQDNSSYRGGATIFKVGGVRYVAVGSPAGPVICPAPRDGRLRIFRFHPCDPDYSPTGPSGGPATPVAERLFVGTDCDHRRTIQSTPLVLPDDKIIVTMTSQLWCGDLSGLTCPEPSQPPLDIPDLWPPSDISFRGVTSPGYGRTSQTGPARIFVLSNVGDGKVFSIDPANGEIVWEQAVPGGNKPDSTPAVGPLSGSPRNLVYVAPDGTIGQDVQHFSALYADGNDGEALAWSAFINKRFYVTCQEAFRKGIGTLASASVRDDGGVLSGSDDGAMYAFANVAGYDPLTNNERWPLPECNPNPPFYGDPADLAYFVSSTAGLSANGDVIFWTGGGRLYHFLDNGTTFVRHRFRNLGVSGAVFGAPVLDRTDRVYIASPGNTGNGLGQVRAYRYTTGGFTDPDYRWAFTPPIVTYGDPPQQRDLRRRNFAPLAMDEDGTLIMVNEGFVLALRPLVGDLDGDSALTCADGDAFAMALLDPNGWETQYGAPIGVNLLGVGDCNNDGRFDNFDIDCFTARICPYCGGCGEGNYPAFSSPEAQHFWELMEWLRAYYGMR